MKRRLPEIDGAKFLLMLGVVLIHSNVADIGADLSVFPPGAADAVRFFSSYLCSVCVPVFFLISGFLLFRGVDRLTVPLYVSKMRSRVRTLLIPYLAWNAIGAVVFLFKVYALGFPGFDAVVDGRFDPVGFLRGFWVIQVKYPYDYPMWFLRNLIVMTVLSPAVYAVCRRSAGMAAVVVLSFVFDTQWYGALWFGAGIWLGGHERMFGRIDTRTGALAGVVLWVTGAAAIEFAGIVSWQRLAVMYVMVGGALAAMLGAGRYMSGHGERMERLYRSTFFIFGLHGLYCTQLRKIFERLFGLDTYGGVAGAYLATFITLVVTTLVAYRLLLRISPRTASILTGGRR